MNGDPSMVRGALVIVLTGAALGMVYNGMGLRSHPPHGIPWIAVKEELPSLEALTDSIAGAPAVEQPRTEAAAPGSAPGSSPGSSAVTSIGTSAAVPSAADRGATPPTHRAASPGAPPPAPAGRGTAPAGGASEPAATTPVPEPHRAAPLPFIPESDKPIQVQLAAAQRFFEARAALFLDARDPAEYEAGHIPGAVRLTGPEANTDPDRMKALGAQSRPIICYCEGGACEASLDLAKTLIGAGYKKVLVYMGGFPEWSAAGQPVEKGGAK